jgi:uncharacterized protein (DUF1501 family)
MPRLAFAPQGQAPRGDVLVVVFQRGGMDGLNALVPVGDSDYYRLRPELAIPEPKAGDDKSAIDLNGFFALHPALRPLKPIYDAGQLAPVHAVGSPDPTHSHFDAMDTMERGTPGAKSLVSGWIGRHLASFNSDNDSPLRAVGIGSMVQASLRGPVPATALKSIADFHYQGRQRERDLAQFQTTLSALYRMPSVDPALTHASAQVNDTIALLSEINVTNYTPDHAADYPESDFGRGLTQIAQLIKAEVGLEVACVDIGGWDTHANQGGAEGQLAGLLGEFGQGLAALWQDLGERMQHVTIVTMSEFGRRAAENGSRGTDHGHANAMFLIGGSIAGGKVHADWPTLAADKLDGPGDLALTTDYRDILSEVLSKRVGNAAIKDVFPGYTPTLRNVVRA